MYVLRYHKYIMVDPYAAGSREWYGTLLATRAVGKAVRPGGKNRQEFSGRQARDLLLFTPNIPVQA